jgi:hypothetical protein
MNEYVRLDIGDTARQPDVIRVTLTHGCSFTKWARRFPARVTP